MLNYKQLHHYWTAARAGGIVRGAERSGLAPQTLSGQIATLETDLGVSLFKRLGQLRVHRAGQGVFLVRTVEAQGEQTAFAFEQDGFGHQRYSTLKRATEFFCGEPELLW